MIMDPILFRSFVKLWNRDHVPISYLNSGTDYDNQVSFLFQQLLHAVADYILAKEVRVQSPERRAVNRPEKVMSMNVRDHSIMNTYIFQMNTDPHGRIVLTQADKVSYQLDDTTRFSNKNLHREMRSTSEKQSRFQDKLIYNHAYRGFSQPRFQDASNAINGLIKNRAGLDSPPDLNDRPEREMRILAEQRNDPDVEKSILTTTMIHNDTGYQARVKIACAGSIKSDGRASLFGHEFVELIDPEQNITSLGFAPANGKTTPWGKGQVYRNDTITYPDVCYSRTFNIDELYITKFRQLVEDPSRFFDATVYNALWNSCVDFVMKVLNVLGSNPDDDQGAILPDSNIQKLAELDSDGSENPQNKVSTSSSNEKQAPNQSQNQESTNDTAKQGEQSSATSDGQKHVSGQSSETATEDSVKNEQNTKNQSNASNNQGEVGNVGGVTAEPNIPAKSSGGKQCIDKSKL